MSTDDSINVLLHDPAGKTVGQVGIPAVPRNGDLVSYGGKAYLVEGALFKSNGDVVLAVKQVGSVPPAFR